MRWLVCLAVWVWAAAPATAQQQRDPFNGQFGVIQVAAPPAEAARLATLMGESLGALPPQRPGELDVYLIAASLWSDPVFEREAAQAEEILRAHFGAGAEGRSIILSAGGQGERRYPSATPDNISAAIGRVGAIIDANEDLVVLFLTSHGSPDGSMSIREHNRLGASLRPAHLRDLLAGAGIRSRVVIVSAWLRPAHLRDLLAGAGIRSRVVIVSACFSGAFIAPLADENTIVLTAAAPDRSSFGCQPQRDWTFFGDALFDENLRGGKPLLEAFEDAKRVIERWEREQNLSPPSNPQRYIGARAQELLSRAERNAR